MTQTTGQRSELLAPVGVAFELVKARERRTEQDVFPWTRNFGGAADRRSKIAAVRMHNAVRDAGGGELVVRFPNETSMT